MTGLLTSLNRRFDRVAMHGVRRRLLEGQAERTGLPLHVVDLPHPCSHEDYEKAMTDTLVRLKGDGITHVAFGDLFLEDVRTYRETSLAPLDLTPLFPL